MQVRTGLLELGTGPVIETSAHVSTEKKKKMAKDITRRISKWRKTNGQQIKRKCSASLESKTIRALFFPYLNGKISFSFSFLLFSPYPHLSLFFFFFYDDTDCWKSVRGYSHTQLVVLWIGTAYLEGNLADCVKSPKDKHCFWSSNSTSRNFS